MAYRIEDESTATLPPIITCEEAAGLARCSTRHIARMCERGELRAKKIGKGWKINTADLLEAAGLAE